MKAAIEAHVAESRPDVVAAVASELLAAAGIAGMDILAMSHVTTFCPRAGRLAMTALDGRNGCVRKALLDLQEMRVRLAPGRVT